MSELLKINNDKFKLSAEKIQSLQKPYHEIDTKYQELIPDVDKILAEGKVEITPKLVARAKLFKNSLVKIRTGSEKIKTKEKEQYLRGGQATQAVYNTIKETVGNKEIELDKIIKHFENLEIERKKELRLERMSLLSPFNVENVEDIALGEMEQIVFDGFLQNAETKYKEKIKAEEDKKAKEKQEKEENEKLKKENKKILRQIKVIDTKISKQEAEKIVEKNKKISDDKIRLDNILLKFNDFNNLKEFNNYWEISEQTILIDDHKKILSAKIKEKQENIIEADKKLERQVEYKKFRESFGYTLETKDNFIEKKESGKVILYKKLGEFII